MGVVILTISLSAHGLCQQERDKRSPQSSDSVVGAPPGAIGGGAVGGGANGGGGSGITADKKNFGLCLTGINGGGPIFGRKKRDAQSSDSVVGTGAVGGGAIGGGANGGGAVGGGVNPPPVSANTRIFGVCQANCNTCSCLESRCYQQCNKCYNTNGIGNGNGLIAGILGNHQQCNFCSCNDQLCYYQCQKCYNNINNNFGHNYCNYCDCRDNLCYQQCNYKCSNFNNNGNFGLG